MNNLCCWLVTCRPGNSVLVTVVKKPIWPAHAAARRRRAIAYVAGRTEPTVGLAQLSASPTGHPTMSPPAIRAVAEQQAPRCMQKALRKASAAPLRQGIQLHIEQTQVQIERIEQATPGKSVPGLGLPYIHVPQLEHTQRLLTRPPAVMPPGAERRLPVDPNASSEMTTPMENALLVMR